MSELFLRVPLPVCENLPNLGEDKYVIGEGVADMTKSPNPLKGLTHLKESSIIGDAMQLANGAASVFGYIPKLVSEKMRSRTERTKSVLQQTVNVVGQGQRQKAHTENTIPPEDFDAALARITALGKRIEALEAQLELKTDLKRPAMRKSAKKAAKKKASN